MIYQTWRQNPHHFRQGDQRGCASLLRELAAMPELAPQGRRLGMSGYSATMIWGACLQQVNTQKGLTKPFLYKFYKYLQIWVVILLVVPPYSQMPFSAHLQGTRFSEVFGVHILQLWCFFFSFLKSPQAGFVYHHQKMWESCDRPFTLFFIHLLKLTTLDRIFGDLLVPTAVNIRCSIFEQNLLA